MKSLVTILLSFCICFVFFLDIANASIVKDIVTQNAFGNSAQSTVKNKGFDSETYIYVKIGEVVLTALRFSGVVLLIVILFGGFTWMTAGGNQEKVTTGRKWLTNGIIGAVIVGLAYLIVGFVMGSLFK